MPAINKAKTFYGKDYITDQYVNNKLNLPQNVEKVVNDEGKISGELLPNGFITYSFTNQDLVQGKLIKTYIELGLTTNQPIFVQIIDNNGVIQDGSSLLSIVWLSKSIKIDLSLYGTIEGVWKLIFVGNEINLCKSNPIIIQTINNIVQVSSLTQGGYYFDYLPIMVQCSSGKFYTIQNGSLIKVGEKYFLDFTPYLAYENMSVFSGTWKIHLNIAYDQTSLIANLNMVLDTINGEVV